MTQENKVAPETAATDERRPGNGHSRPPEDPRYFVTYPELAALGVRYSRKHLLELMRRGLFPPAYQLSANRVAWRYDDIIAYRASRPIARAAVATELTEHWCGPPRKRPWLPDRDAEAKPAAEAGTDAAAGPARRPTGEAF